MNKLLERNIRELANRVFDQALRKFSGSKSMSPRYQGQYAEIEIAPRVYLAFEKWGDDWRKPFFLILWRGSNYLMEFDLSRVIFAENGKLTWILNIPTRTRNKQNLLELGYQIQKINPAIVEKIHEQMAVCNVRARRTPKGYILVQDQHIDEAIARLLDIICYSIRSDQELDARKKHEDGDEDITALEGQIAEIKVLGRRRNRAIVEQRKNADQYTCQACRFRVQVNGRHVIECHHKFPLRGERITKLNDLVCLCPTCHRIAHRRDRPYSVEEIQNILSNSRRNRGKS